MSENTQSTQIPVGIIGAGGWGKTSSAYFLRFREPVSNMSATSMKRGGQQFRRTILTSGLPNTFETILNDDSLQAVIIATPADTHYRLIKQSLESRRLHVYTEKPLTLNENDAQEIVALAGETDKILMVGHLLLYHPAVRKLKSLLRAASSAIYTVSIPTG